MQAGTQAQVNHCYDAANLLLTLTSGGIYQCPSPNPTVTIAYDQDGRRQSLALPNGVSVGYYYDADSRISSLVTPRRQPGISVVLRIPTTQIVASSGELENLMPSIFLLYK
jgi:YD repeat-containing protein